MKYGISLTLLGVIAVQAVPVIRETRCTSTITRTVTRTIAPNPVMVTVEVEVEMEMGVPVGVALEVGVEEISTWEAKPPYGNPEVPNSPVMAAFTPACTRAITTSNVTPQVSITTVPTTNGTAQVLPSLSTQSPATEGLIITGLNSTGLPTSPPIISTSISSPSTTISTSSVTSVASSVVPGLPSANIFQPLATNEPHMSIPSRADHPVPRLGINQTAPIGTNKFYSNFFLGGQDDPTWTNPYSVTWAKGRGGSWGMSITHVEASQRVFGPPEAAPPVFFTNPTGIQSLVLSATELDAATILTTDHLTAFSARVNLSPGNGEPASITFPLVQGMGFVTGIYNGGTPVLQSGVLFRSVTKVDKSPKPGVTKYRIVLEDGKEWLLYASSPDGKDLLFQVVNSGLAQATSNFNGFIQIAKNPGNAEDTYDAACSTYPTDVILTGSVSDDKYEGSYTLSFRKSGLSNSALLMFALPHHVQSLSTQTETGLTDIQLTTTTKGIATAIIGDSWTLVEELPAAVGFGPWSAGLGSLVKLSPAAIAAMKDIAASEVSQDMHGQTNLDSMYFSGKALAKFAGIVYTLHDLMDEKSLGQAGLNTLKDAFATFVENKQQFPLVYESAWGGVVSTGSYITGNSGVDFGNTYYNDHHFHYGYFVYTAAVIAHLDPTFLSDTSATSFITTLLRDISNPSSLDPYFPVSRSFDYYHGHSWAKGLFASYDGKDQESSSEDMMFAYAIKLWGLASGDANTEARGSLQLAIAARSLKNYFLYESDNAVQPPSFIPNKVAGILFENKIDHTTYFGTRIEYIQGIHMLPLLPCSVLSRSKRFVQEEWDVYFSNGRADQAEGGWRGVLYANLAIVDPRRSWDFFSQGDGWDSQWIDGGASRTWYLAMAAGLGGGP